MGNFDKNALAFMAIVFYGHFAFLALWAALLGESFDLRREYSPVVPGLLSAAFILLARWWAPLCKSWCENTDGRD
jgi:hypothetical protein